MTHDLAGSSFVRRLQTVGPALDDRACRRLVLGYASLYQQVYGFESLERTFAELQAVDGEPGRLGDGHAVVLAEVREAMAEYFISLNEVATALHRLLDPTPMTSADALTCVSHLWNAHACNEELSEFSAREDRALCELLADLLPA